MNRFFSRLVPGALALAFCSAQPVAAQPKEPGDLWEVRTEMSMPGMPAGMQMPQRPPQRVCQARSSDQPPVGDNDGKCELYDLKRTANSFAWKMRCEGGTSGAGEMVYEGRDRYKGTIDMSTGGQSMTLKLSGNRVGDCDAGEMKRQVNAQMAAIQKQSADATAANCKGAVDSLTPYLLRPETGLKCDAKYKTELCTKAQTADGFTNVAARPASTVPGRPGNDMKEVAGFCGFDAMQVRVRLCKRADEQEQLDFLASTCLGYARTDGSTATKAADSFGSTIIVRECAGRTFSSPPGEKYRPFCSAVVRQKLIQPVVADAGTGTGATAKPEEKKEDAATRGKKLLKDIFTR